MNPATAGPAAWLGSVTDGDRPWWMPPEDVEVHRAAAEREAERIRREREVERERLDEEFLARLQRARIVEAATGAPSVPSVADILARESARGDRAAAAEDLRAGLL